MKQTILITYAKPWRMVDDITGEIREGISLDYLVTDNLKPVKNEDGSQGIIRGKESISIDKISQIQNVPGIYDAEYVMTMKANKPFLKISNVAFKSDVK